MRHILVQNSKIDQTPLLQERVLILSQTQQNPLSNLGLVVLFQGFFTGLFPTKNKAHHVLVIFGVFLERLLVELV